MARVLQARNNDVTLQALPRESNAYQVVSIQQCKYPSNIVTSLANGVRTASTATHWYQAAYSPKRCTAESISDMAYPICSSDTQG